MIAAPVYLRRGCATIDSGAEQLERTEANGLIYYRHATWATLRHGIFTRHGGVSAAPWQSLNLGASVGDSPTAVTENRRRLLAHFGLEHARVGTLWLVHSADVLQLDAPPSVNGQMPQADALITDQPDVPLLLRFADCVPLLFYDPARAAIGMAHAGWRGTALGIAAQTIQAMQNAYGCSPSSIQSIIGPSICGACYEVGAEVMAAINRRFSEEDLANCASPSANGRWLLDLPAVNRLEMERAGLQHIHDATPCTACHCEDFFSHRAEGGRTGRFGALLCL